MPCTDSIVDENLDFCPTDEQVGGTSNTQIWYCAHRDFTTIAEPPALDVAVSYEEAATIATAHTFTAPKGFKKLEVLPDTGVVESAIEGETGSKSVSNSFGGTLPGVSARNAGWFRKHKNLGMIFIVTERNGVKKQIGSKVNPAYISEASASSGLKSADVNGIPFKITDVQAYLAPVYAAVVTEFTPA